MPKLPSPTDFERQIPQPDSNIISMNGTEVGQAMEGAGFKLLKVGDMIRQETEKLDTLQASDRINKLKLKAIDFQYGDNGFSRAKGEQILNSGATGKPFMEDWSGKFQTEVDALTSTLATDSQKEMFKRLAGKEAVTFQHGVAQHASSEVQKHTAKVFDSTINNNIVLGSANWRDPDKFQESSNTITQQIFDAQQKFGLSDAEAEEKLRAAKSTLYGSAIVNAIAGNDLAKAEQYYAANQGGFTTKDGATVFSALKTAQAAVQVSDGVNLVMGGVKTRVTSLDRYRGFSSARIAMSADDLKNSLFGQESSSGGADTSKVNYANATGPMQITGDTWKTFVNRGVIPKDWNWKDAAQNKEAGFKIVDYYYDKYEGDPAKVAAAYYGGEGAVNADGSINRHWKDLAGTRAALAKGKKPPPTVGEYVDQVLGRAGFSNFDANLTKAGGDPLRAWAMEMVSAEELKEADRLAAESTDNAQVYKTERAKLNLPKGVVLPGDSMNQAWDYISFLPENVQSELARRSVGVANLEGAKEDTEMDVRDKVRTKARTEQWDADVTAKVEAQAVAKFKQEKQAVADERTQLMDHYKQLANRGDLTSVDQIPPQHREAMGGDLNSMRTYIDSSVKGDSQSKMANPNTAALYYDLLTDPNKVSQMTVPEIMSYSEALGSEAVKHLLDKRKSLKESGNTGERAAHINKQAFEADAVRMGYSLSSASDKKELALIYNRLTTSITAEQTKTNKVLTQAEISDLTTKALTKLPFKNSYFGGGDRLIKLEPGDAVAVPPAFAEQLIAAGRKAGREPSAKEIREKFILFQRSKQLEESKL